MRPPEPEDFGLTREEVGRIQARHDRIWCWVARATWLVPFGAWLGLVLALCDTCSLLVDLVLALALFAVVGSISFLIGPIVVSALYPLVAARLSPAYRAATRYASALEEYRALAARGEMGCEGAAGAVGEVPARAPAGGRGGRAGKLAGATSSPSVTPAR